MLGCFGACRHALTKFRHDLTLAEISGAMGDLGTFLPLIVGLVKMVELDLGTTLLFTGIYNIITGLMFDIPMPVQPMKTIAAVALAESGALTLPQIMAAGIFVSSCVLFLGATGLMGVATRLIPPAVIRGMQLGVGLALGLKGLQQVWYVGGKPPAIRQWWSIEGLFLGLFAVVFILLTVYPSSDVGQNEEDGDKESGQEEKSCSGDGSVGAASSAANRASNDPLKASSNSLMLHQERFDRDRDGVVEIDLGEIEGGTPAAGAALSSRGQGAREETAARTAALGRDPPLSASNPPLATTPASLRFPSRIHHAVSPTVHRILKPLLALGARADVATGGRAHTNSNPCSASDTPATRIPSALLLVILGIILTIAFSPSVLSTLSLGPSTPQIIVPSAADWRVAILRAGLPQLSLTTFNSVISVCQLSERLFPDRPAGPGHVATSVGLMNLIGCWFGAMPSCHGAGGLAGQVRFGARTGAAPIFLGLVKILLSLLLGSSLFQLLQLFPGPLLGAMLVFAGMELAAVAQGQRTVRGVAIMLFTACVTLGLNNVAWGVVFGLVGAYLLALRDWIAIEAVPVVRRKVVLLRRGSAAPPGSFCPDGSSTVV